ncbi:hypothetical protein ACJIZ3_005113 [Penstemon smallii]|uniref:PA domain-containing protein n=1 Tax=Penstemon smallii TaxID=265156 RepID=A0ABD3S4B7_9LAMI
MVEKNSLRVTSPHNIKENYDSAIGNFGILQYGGRSKSFDDFGISFKAKVGALLNLVLIGFCALKVWNAQNAGAAAVLVADNIDEALTSMDSPEEDGSSAKYIVNITIPSTLISKSFGEKLKAAISGGDMVNLNLDWREVVPHPDNRVEYERWANSNDKCGFKCDMYGACGYAFTISKQCKSQCINHGKYCAPDPEQDFSTGYEGKDVVLENLRQLCVSKVASETKKSWFGGNNFQIRRPMKEKNTTRNVQMLSLINQFRHRGGYIDRSAESNPYEIH